MLIGVVLLCACHTTRHVVSEQTVSQDTQSTHQEQTTTQRLDSLISHLSASADSITIELYGDTPVPAQADSLVPAQPLAKTPSPKSLNPLSPGSLFPGHVDWECDPCLG